jgi:hypothetical protein
MGENLTKVIEEHEFVIINTIYFFIHHSIYLLVFIMIDMNPSITLTKFLLFNSLIAL